eukprot:scaffold1179_cov118-Isochrysis_galbana.AAC.17
MWSDVDVDVDTVLVLDSDTLWMWMHGYGYGDGRAGAPPRPLHPQTPSPTGGAPERMSPIPCSGGASSILRRRHRPNSELGRTAQPHLRRPGGAGCAVGGASKARPRRPDRCTRSRPLSPAARTSSAAAEMISCTAANDAGPTPLGVLPPGTNRGLDDERRA